MSVLDCIVAGSCVVDMLCRPVPLDRPLGGGVLHEVQPIELTTGGITSNAGITLARLGLKAGVFSYVGRDAFAGALRTAYEREGVDRALLLEHETGATSTTVVAIDASGERSFLHCVGAPKLMDKALFMARLEELKRASWFLMGYYSLMPRLEPDLPEVFRALRATGVKTALDSAGQGGAMDPLERILPQVDLYVPSRAEAEHQTGLRDPEAMVAKYRACGAPGVLGVKLGGKDGVVLSGREGEIVRVPSCVPPGPVVDTTGAGDSFLGGLIAGLVRGLPLEKAGRIGTAAAACCVTALGGSNGGRSWDETCRIAGV